MSVPDSESMLLDFDGWLGGQDPATRAGLQEHLNAVPAESRDAEKKRLASTFVVAADTGVDLQAASDQWDTVRGGYAEQKGGSWLAVKDDEGAFYNQLRTQAQQQRDERHLLSGPDDLSEPGAKEATAASLESLTFNAALLGQSSAEAFKAWQQNAQGKPGFDPSKADVYFEQARALHDSVTQRFSPVLELADDAFRTLSTGKDLEAASERLLPQVDQLGDQQRRDFLTALRVMADSSPDNTKATFWGNFAKQGGRDVAGTGRGFMDFLAAAGGAQAIGDASLSEMSGAAPEGFQRELMTDFGKALREHNLESDLRRVQEQDYSPVRDVLPKGWQWAERGAYGTSGALASTAEAMIPAVGLPALFGTMAGQAYEQERFRLLDSGMSDHDASVHAATLAPIVAAPQAALMELRVGALAGKFPALQSALNAIGDKAGSGVLGLAARAAGHTAAQLPLMEAQGLMQPTVDAAAAALDKDLPGVTWKNGENGVLDGFWARTGESFVSLLPLVLTGAAFTGNARTESLAKASDLQLRAFGAKNDDITTFRAAVAKGPASAMDAAQALLSNRDGNSDAAKAAVAELTAQERQRAAMNDGSLQTDMREAGVSKVTRNENGWAIVHDDGTQTQVGSDKAATSILSDLKQANSQKEADALVSIIDQWHDKAPAETKRETTLTGETARSEGSAITYSKPGEGVTREVTSPAVLDSLREEARMDARRSGDQAIDVLVNGSNTVEFRERVADGAMQVVQRLELNQSESTALTALHEQLEAAWREGIGRGTVSLEETWKAVASVADALDPARARDEADRAFRERVQRVAGGKASDTETRETVSELAVADVLGRRRDGGSLPAGTITTVLDAAIRNAADPAEAKQIGTFRAFLRAAKTYFRGVLGTVAALRKKKGEGGAKELSALVDKLTGLHDQRAHEAAVADDLEGKLPEYKPPTPEEEANSIAFSLKPPPAYREMVEEKGYPAVSIGELAERSGIPLEEMKKRVLEAWRAGKVVLSTGDWSLSDETTRAGAVEAGGQRNLQVRWLDKGFRLSPGKRLELIQKRLDDALGRDPEQRRELGQKAAQKLQALQFGWETERYTPKGDLIRPIEEQRTAAELDKEQAARQALRADELIKQGAPEKEAKNQAREEAFDWRQRENEKQKIDWAPRARLVRDLRTLDAITSVLPPEIRGKVGGFVKLAQLGTDAARVEEIGRRIDKIGGLLEEHLKTETAAALDALVERAQPNGGAGERAGGKIGVEGHRFFDQLQAARSMSEGEARVRQDAIEEQLSGALTDAERGALLEEWGILQAYGAFDKKTAAEMDTALRQAQAVYQNGRSQWNAVLEQRAQERASLREKAIAEIGKEGGGRARQDAMASEAAGGQRRKLVDFFTNAHLSFAQRISRIFGPGEITSRYERAVTRAYHEKQTALNEHRTALRDTLLKAFGEKSWWVAQDKLHALQLPRENSGVFRVEGRRTEVRDFPVDVAQRIVDGGMTADAHGLPDEKVAELADLLKQNEKAEHPRQVLKMDVTTNEGQRVEQRISGLQAVHLTMLARNEQYRAAMERHGWDDAARKQLEGMLSPEARAIRGFLSRQYEEGYKGLNKVFRPMFGIDLPRVENYAPGYFEHAGAQSEMDPFGSGIDAGGLAAGFLKSRKNHLAEPTIIDALQAFWQHTMQTEHWKSFAPLVSEMRSVLGAVDVRHAIEASGGRRAAADVSDWITHIEKNGAREAQSNAWLGRVMTGLTRARLSFNIGTWMKHLPNAFASLADVPAMDWMRGLGNVLSGKSDASLKAIWGSELIRNRIGLSFTPELRQVMAGERARPSKVGDFLDWGVARIPWIASAFTTFSAAIAHDYHLRAAREAGLTGEQAAAHAMRETELTVARTAQTESIDRRSLAELDRKGVGRLAMMFVTPERQQLGMALAAVLNAKEGKMPKGDAARVLFSTWVLAPVLMQTMVGLAKYAFTDEDAEEAWSWKRYAAAVTLGPVSGWFGLGQIAEVAASHFKGELTRAGGSPFVTAAQAIFSGAKGIEKWVHEDGEFALKDIEHMATGLSELLSGFTDVPVEAISAADRLFRQTIAVLPDTEADKERKEKRELAKERRESRQ